MAKNPIKDEDESVEAANERAVESIKKGASSPPAEEDAPELAVSSGDDEGETDEREDRPSRSERRANRYREQQERADAAERRARELEDRLSWLERQRQEPSPPPRQAPAEPEEDPALSRVYLEQDRLQAEYSSAHSAGTLTAAAIAEYQAKWRGLQTKAVEVAADARVRRAISESLREQQGLAERAAIRAQHADVYDHGKAVQWARGYYHQQLAMGRPDTRALFDESMSEARKHFRIGGGPAPTQESRARYAGQASNSGGARSIESSGPVTVKMTKENKRLADAFAPHIKDDAKRYQHWVNKVGKGLVGK